MLYQPRVRVKYSSRAMGDNMPVGKVIELVGSSNKGFEDAIVQVIERTSRTVKNIRGVDVMGQTAVVKNGKITEYRVHLKVAFGVE